MSTLIADEHGTAPAPRAATARPSRTLRLRLARALTLPLVVLFGIGGGLTYVVARHYADSVYDRWLYDSASSLARQVRLQRGHAELDLPRVAQEIFEWDDEDQTLFRVTGSVSGHIAGQVDLPMHGEHLDRFRGASLFNAPARGRPMRWVALELDPEKLGEKVTVLVGETTHKRDRLADEILAAVWVPEIALMLVVGWIAYRVISVQTQRIHSMSKALRDYSYRELDPLQREDLPEELAPLLEALNAMLSKRDRAAVAQRAFIANAAHQLRTPLTAINLQAEQAAHCTDLDTMRESVLAVQLAAQRAARLANQLLLLSRAEPDAQSNRYRTRVDLRDVAFDAASAWVEKAMARDVDLGFDDEAARVTVDIDEALVREALNNLVDNAIKYCPRGARVTVSVTGGADPAVIVEDNGPGIAPAERGRVVQRFYRGDNASGEGTGLGLAIVHEVALAHGGAFVITDSREGGTRCEIHLPAPARRPGTAGSTGVAPRMAGVPSPERG